MTEQADGWSEALAPAKINLHLAVLGRRPDGFHEIDTLMMAVELADRVRARRSPRAGIALSVRGPQASDDVPCDEQNLVWRAARAVLELAGAEAGEGLELELEKHIPSAAGLGGASADAAAAVLAAEAALGRTLAAEARRALLARLGSDCAFFLEAADTGLARCAGRGERVEPIERGSPPWWVSLLTPPVHCPTGAVYAAWRPPLCSETLAPSLRDSIWSRPAASVRSDLFNELEEAALRAVPGLLAWKEALARCGARHLRLSGSGSTFYGLHGERTDAESELALLVATLQDRGLAPRFARVVRPAGHGALLTRRRGESLHFERSRIGAPSATIPENELERGMNPESGCPGGPE